MWKFIFELIDQSKIVCKISIWDFVESMITQCPCVTGCMYVTCLEAAKFVIFLPYKACNKI